MTRTKCYPFAAICPRNLSNLVEEWYSYLPERWTKEMPREVVHVMGLALSKAIFRDGEDDILNVAHDEFMHACMVILGGTCAKVLEEDTRYNPESGLYALVCGALFEFLNTKLYHRDSGKSAKDIVLEAAERVKEGAEND